MHGLWFGGYTVSHNSQWHICKYIASHQHSSVFFAAICSLELRHRFITCISRWSIASLTTCIWCHLRLTMDTYLQCQSFIADLAEKKALARQKLLTPSRPPCRIESSWTCSENAIVPVTGMADCRPHLPMWIFSSKVTTTAAHGFKLLATVGWQFSSLK